MKNSVGNRENFSVFLFVNSRKLRGMLEYFPYSGRTSLLLDLFCLLEMKEAK